MDELKILDLLPNDATVIKLMGKEVVGHTSNNLSYNKMSYNNFVFLCNENRCLPRGGIIWQ